MAISDNTFPSYDLVGNTLVTYGVQDGAGNMLDLFRTTYLPAPSPATAGSNVSADGVSSKTVSPAPLVAQGYSTPVAAPKAPRIR
jgi:hypothetical protein